MPQFDLHVQTTGPPPCGETRTPDLSPCQAWLTNSTPESLEQSIKYNIERMQMESELNPVVVVSCSLWSSLRQMLLTRNREL